MVSKEQDRKQAREEDFARRRKYVRAPFYTKAGISPGPDGPWTEAEVLDISFGGVHLCFDGPNPPDYSRDDPCAVKFHAKGEDRVYQGSIAWIKPAAAEEDRYPDGAWEAGVNFGELPREKKQEILTVFMWTKLEQSGQ